MSDYTPNYGSAREMYAYGADSFHGTVSRPENRAEFDRFIRKVEAGALREAAESARAVIEIGSSGDSAYHHGARYGQRKFADWLDVRAERIEGKRDKRVAGRWEPQA